jgi:hypothetical protein
VAQTFTKLKLSGSTDGRPIQVAATATAGTTIHTATSSTGDDSYDEVWLWASSTSVSAINATVQIGASTGSEAESLNVRVPAAYNGPIAVMPGWPLRNGTVLTATAATAGRIQFYGYANRISLQSS